MQKSDVKRAVQVLSSVALLKWKDAGMWARTATACPPEMLGECVGAEGFMNAYRAFGETTLKRVLGAQFGIVAGALGVQPTALPVASASRAQAVLVPNAPQAGLSASTGPLQQPSSIPATKKRRSTGGTQTQKKRTKLDDDVIDLTSSP